MGQNIIITKPNGDHIPLESRRTATRITSGKQTWALNAEDTLSITIESPFPQQYSIGDTISIFGRIYKLNRLPKVKKTGMADFQYELEFEGLQYDLLRVTYDLNIDTTNNELQDVQGDSLTGDLRRFMVVLIANANRVFPGKWVLGTCPETIGDKTLTFGESDNCLSVLQNLCGSSNFNVEFEIETANGIHTVNLKERVGQTLPYIFQYGKGNGLYALNRENVSSANIVTRLKVFGSTENITTKYRADRLCLPGKSKAQSYIEKPTAIAKYGVFEGRKNFDDIKPTFTGKISATIQGDVLAFVDKTFPFDLNAKEPDGKTTKYLISGMDAKIHFNTGNLAGYDFTVKKYDHGTHIFTINKITDSRGDVFPSESSQAFQFAVGDEYKITDIAYSEDIERAAERELAEQANIYYDQNCQPKVQYGLTVTKSWLERLVEADDNNVVNVFAPGDYLHIVDDDIDVDKSVRIKSFARNILDPYEYTLTISDITTNTQIVNRVISDLIDIDKVLTINNLKDPTRARANWRSSREVLDMVFDPEGDYYTDKIKPNSIDTLALSVGAKSMQFALTNTVFQPNYNGNKNVIKWQGGVLTHYTINEESAVSWVLADGQLTLGKDSDAYYIYAKCAKGSQAGTIVFSKQQHKVDDDANYYYFWIGVLNSVNDELKARSIALTYGFTMVNGRFIKTGRIESADGTTYFDLDNSEIGGRIVFTSNGQEKTLEELGKEALESKDFINNTLPGVLGEMESQIDGKIETWFQTTDPAAAWKDISTIKKHVGDIWYNTKTQLCKRFSSAYSWETIKDADAIKALSDASKAQDTADGKRRVFTATPYPPYDVGDLWSQGANGDLMVCDKVRTSGEYVSTDWRKATKYTGDEEFNNFVDSYNKTIANIYSQLDGQIEQFFYETDPLPASLEDYEEVWQNAPANEWHTIKEKENHLGDLYYNTTSGKVWRWIKAGDIDPAYYWRLLQDTEVSQALALANDALALSKEKRRIFTATPYPPYDVGDLWSQGANGDLMVCNKARTNGEYVSTDWGKATNYTDDSALTSFINGAYADAITGLKNQIDGKIETWFQTTDPAENWTDDNEMILHNGDMWYNLTAKTLWIWRLVYDDESGSFMFGEWAAVKDNDAIAAYEAASKAQDTADGKRRVFTATPYPPYDVGDLWSQGAKGDLMVCNKARTSGEYVSTDWEKATNYTDDSALVNFINGVYADTIDNITAQIDGKIETWFQTIDPAEAWVTLELKASHVGDMWYHVTENELKYYSSSYEWIKVEDKKAIEAYEAASKAQDTADGKRRVFITTPYPPYDVGDLWVDGKDLRRCVTPKVPTEDYMVNDWVVCVDYDNTKTTINGGIVTSGTIQVAGDNKSILAGITGQGTAATSIRFWAGASFENRATAPYRVMQDGSVVMTKATVEGVINALSGYIGGFRIRQGQIGSGSTSELDDTYGLCMTDSFIRFKDNARRVLLGCLNSMSYKLAGLMELHSDSGTTLELRRTMPNPYWERDFRPKALSVKGNAYFNGKVAIYENGYIGEALSNTIESYIYITHSFMFTKISVSSLAVRLPDLRNVWNYINGWNTFELKIQVGWLGNNNQIAITGVDGGTILDNNGNRFNGGLGTVYMSQGDGLTLRAYGVDYYVVNYAN